MDAPQPGDGVEIARWDDRPQTVSAILLLHTCARVVLDKWDERIEDIVCRSHTDAVEVLVGCIVVVDDRHLEVGSGIVELVVEAPQIVAVLAVLQM